MAASGGPCFVEWKEQFVSKERGNRVVHYYLKDIAGESILAVVGTERSVRHMFYVVSEEFLKAHGAEGSVNASYRWRSRREVVNWLTSSLSKQHRLSDYSILAKGDSISGGGAQQIQLPDCKGRLSRSLKGHSSDIVWSGVPWLCGKQLKHYPAFCRNGITIAIQSFVFVMAEEENGYLAYLEDMYEDRKGQKKVKVRWFHHNREVQGVVSLRNPHPKEVFITPYSQVISVECVDGLAIVVTREHYEKFLAVLPQDKLARVHLCFRQFKSNRVKPFKLSKLCGYFDQPIFSCLDPALIEDEDFSPQGNVKLGAKRTRSCRGRQVVAYEQSGQKLNYGKLRRLIHSKHVKCPPLETPVFKTCEKLELLCQDSGIRGCWFKCTVLQVSQRQIKVKYDDVKDEDGCGNLEEWIPAFRLATPDKLGMRQPQRPTIRPAIPHNETDLALEIGSPVDAWWSDGWWEGVLTEINNSGDENMQVYVPSENLFLNVHRKNLRVSRDWVGDRWVTIETKPTIISVIAALVSHDTKVSTTSTNTEVKYGCFPTSCDEVLTNAKLEIVEEEKPDLVCAERHNAVPENRDCTNEDMRLMDDKNEKNNSNDICNFHEKDGADGIHNNEGNGSHINNFHGKNSADCVDNNNTDDDDDGEDANDDDCNDSKDDHLEEEKDECKLEIGKSGTLGQESEPEIMEVVA